MAETTAARVQKRRNALRLAGLRPVQIWVPDTRQPNFALECARQSRLVAQDDMSDKAMHQFMLDSANSIDAWTA